MTNPTPDATLRLSVRWSGSPVVDETPVAEPIRCRCWKPTAPAHQWDCPIAYEQRAALCALLTYDDCHLYPDAHTGEDHLLPRTTCLAHLQPEPCPTCAAYIAAGL